MCSCARGGGLLQSIVHSAGGWFCAHGRMFFTAMRTDGLLSFPYMSFLFRSFFSGRRGRGRLFVYTQPYGFSSVRDGREQTLITVKCRTTQSTDTGTEAQTRAALYLPRKEKKAHSGYTNTYYRHTGVSRRNGVSVYMRRMGVSSGMYIPDTVLPCPSVVYTTDG